MEHLGNVVHNPIDHFSLEWFEDYCTITGDEFGLATSAQYHAFSDIQDGDDSNDVPECA